MIPQNENKAVELYDKLVLVYNWAKLFNITICHKKYSGVFNNPYTKVYEKCQEEVNIFGAALLYFFEQNPNTHNKIIFSEETTLAKYFNVDENLYRGFCNGYFAGYCRHWSQSSNETNGYFSMYGHKLFKFIVNGIYI